VKQKLIFFLSITFLLQTTIFATKITTNDVNKSSNEKLTIPQILANGIFLAATAAIVIDRLNTGEKTIELNQLNDKEFIKNTAQRDLLARQTTFKDCFKTCLKQGNQHNNNRVRKEHCSKKCVQQALDQNNVPYGPHCWGNHRDYCFCGDGTCKSDRVEEVLKAQKDQLRQHHLACQQKHVNSSRKESICARQFHDSMRKTRARALAKQQN
jgi:hypothetical protein